MIANDEVAFAREGERATGDELDKEATRVLESVQITRTAPQPVLRDISTAATPKPVAAPMPTPTLGGGITFNAPPPGSAVVAGVVPSPAAVVAGDATAETRAIDWRAVARAAWPWLLIAAVSYLSYRVATGDGGADRWT